MTPANDQDLLIDDAVSLLREAMTNSKMRAALPSQEQQESAIHETLSMVAIVISETPVPEIPPASLHLPVAQRNVSNEIEEHQTVALVAETLSMVKTVSEPNRIEVEQQSLQQPASPGAQESNAKEATAEERLAVQRADIRKRMETFKANQERFKQEREEYYAATMAKVRAAIGPR